MIQEKKKKSLSSKSYNIYVWVIPALFFFYNYLTINAFGLIKTINTLSGVLGDALTRLFIHMQASHLPQLFTSKTFHDTLLRSSCYLLIVLILLFFIKKTYPKKRSS